MPSRGSHFGQAVALVLALTACAPNGGDSSVTTTPSGTAAAIATSTPISSPSVVANPCDVGDFGPLPVGVTCWTDIEASERSPVRIEYTIPADGWAAFLGPYKDVDSSEDLQRVTVNFADIQNVTVDACEEQFPASPPVGPSVADLADALAALPPFEIASDPKEVTAFGYGGMHLAIRVPLDQPYRPESSTFSGCRDQVLRSWIAPPLSFAFYGYTSPGDTEEFWILDVDGGRVVVAALTSANASDNLIAERQQVLDSIVIDRVD